MLRRPLTALALPLLLLAACADTTQQPGTHQPGQPGQSGQPPQITTELPDQPEPPECPAPLPEAMNGPGLKLASFTIDNLGVYSSRDNQALACMLGLFDLVAVHDLAVPPYPGSFADGEAYRPDPAAAGFFDAMRGQGFAYSIAPEDTGPGAKNKLTSGVTAWPVVFYKPTVVAIDGSKPSGYILPDHSANVDFDYVPFALPLRTADGRFDFLLLSVKLAEGPDNISRRRNELFALTNWIQTYRRGERDVLVLASPSFLSCAERDGALPSDFTRVDPACRITDVGRKRPSDTVLLAAGATASLEAFDSVDIVKAMYPYWVFSHAGDYPGSPYNPAQFDQYYSGSPPVALRLLPPAGGDND